jgi:hypothetical protein
VTRTLDDERWRLDAACRESPTDWWFATDKPTRARARDVCDRCPVRATCLAYALDHKSVTGVWAGTTLGDRDHMRAWRVSRHELGPDLGSIHTPVNGGSSTSDVSAIS